MPLSGAISRAEEKIRREFGRLLYTDGCYTNEGNRRRIGKIFRDEFEKLPGNVRDHVSNAHDVYERRVQENKDAFFAILEAMRRHDATKASITDNYLDRGELDTDTLNKLVNRLFTAEASSRFDRVSGSAGTLITTSLSFLGAEKLAKLACDLAKDCPALLAPLFALPLGQLVMIGLGLGVAAVGCREIYRYCEISGISMLGFRGIVGDLSEALSGGDLKGLKDTRRINEGFLSVLSSTLQEAVDDEGARNAQAFAPAVVGRVGGNDERHAALRAVG